MIDIKKKILLGEFPQKIHIRTEDRNNPILLFLHGGPGVCNRDVIFTEHLDLLDTLHDLGDIQKELEKIQLYKI